MKVADDRRVAIEYELKVEGENEVVDSSSPGQPLSFIVGHGEIIPGLEKRIIGLEEGEEKTVIVPPDEAYGQVNPQMVIDVSKEELPAGLDVAVGSRLQMQTQNGMIFDGTVTEVRGDSITVDFNHMLAGKTLRFWIRVAEVTEAAA